MSFQCLTLYGATRTNELEKGIGVKHVTVELDLDANKKTDADEEMDRPFCLGKMM